MYTWILTHVYTHIVIVSVSPLFLKGIFRGQVLYIDNFSTLKMWLALFWLALFWRGNCCTLYLSSSVHNVFLPLCLVLSNLINMCPGMFFYFFFFHFWYLRFIVLLWFSSNLETCQLLFLQVFSPLYFSPLSGTPAIRLLEVVYYYVFKLTNIFFCNVYSAINPIQNVFFI